MKPYNLLVTGVGGQGTVVASDILAAVGLAAGYDVKKSDVLGLAVRGGAVVSHVRWADTVHSPIVPEGKVDILLAFELLEGLRWLDWVNPEGAILINDQRIFPVVVSSGVSGYPSDEEVSAALLRATNHAYKVPGLDIAQGLGNSRVLNVALLGAMSGLIEIDPQALGGCDQAARACQGARTEREGFLAGARGFGRRAARRPSRREGNRMKILVINPNTSESMTAHLARELMQLKAPGTELTVVNPEHGPVSIESAYDEALAIPPTLALIKQAEQDGYDAAVIACFSDPGLHAARELVSIPVIGIQEATLHVAAQLGFRFTITTTFPKRVPAKIEAVKANGLEVQAGLGAPAEHDRAGDGSRPGMHQGALDRSLPGGRGRGRRRGGDPGLRRAGRLCGRCRGRDRHEGARPQPHRAEDRGDVGQPRPEAQQARPVRPAAGEVDQVADNPNLDRHARSAADSRRISEQLR